MAKMTEEEADALSEFVLANPPKVDPSKARQVVRLVPLDDISADYIFSVSTADNKTPQEAISEMVRERMSIAPSRRQQV
jgi:hypothetical protein